MFDQLEDGVIRKAVEQLFLKSTSLPPFENTATELFKFCDLFSLGILVVVLKYQRAISERLQDDRSIESVFTIAIGECHAECRNRQFRSFRITGAMDVDSPDQPDLACALTDDN